MTDDSLTARVERLEDLVTRLVGLMSAAGHVLDAAPLVERQTRRRDTCMCFTPGHLGEPCPVHRVDRKKGRRQPP